MINKIYEKSKKIIKENYKFLIGLILIFFFCFYKLPFVIYKPGGIINLSDRIILDNKYDESGSISMSYVSMINGNIPFVLASFLIPNWDLESVKELTLDDEDIDETIKRDRISLENGIDNAILSAYKMAGKKIDIEKEEMIIMYITKDANTNLEIGDIILKADNKEIKDLDELKKYINSKSIGDYINFKVLRNNKEEDKTAKIYEDESGLKVGVSIEYKIKYKTEPEIKVENKKNESGSSGGLVTALQIYNYLTEEDITKGRKIVGTGSIDKDGNVQEIGGIKYKILGANKKKADIFLCPKENYEEALKVKKDNNLDLIIKDVATLEEAIDYLKNVK